MYHKIRYNEKSKKIIIFFLKSKQGLAHTAATEPRRYVRVVGAWRLMMSHKRDGEVMATACPYLPEPVEDGLSVTDANKLLRQ